MLWEKFISVEIPVAKVSDESDLPETIPASSVIQPPESVESSNLKSVKSGRFKTENTENVNGAISEDDSLSETISVKLNTQEPIATDTFLPATASEVKTKHALSVSKLNYTGDLLSEGSVPRQGD